MPQLRDIRLSSILLLFWLVLAVPAHLYASSDAFGADVKGGQTEESAAVSESVSGSAEKEAPAAEDVFAEPAPVRGMPEQVTLRAEADTEQRLKELIALVASVLPENAAKALLK